MGVSFSPDGALLATSSSDKSIKLTSVADGEVVLHLPELHKGGDDIAIIRCVSFSPDGALLATGSHDKSLKLTSMPDGEEVLHLPELHEGGIRGVSFSPDGALLATASHDKSIKLTSVPDGKVVLHLPELHEGGICNVDFSPDGILIATASDDKSIKLTSLPDGEVVLHLPGLHEGPIMRVSFSRDGTLLATASSDGSVKLTSVPDGEVMLHLPGLHERGICSVVFSLDGMLIATASYDKSLKLTTVPDGEVVLHLPGLHEGGIRGLDFSPDGMLIATASDDGVVKLVSVPAVGDVVLHLPGLHEGPIKRVMFSPDGTLLATASGKSVKVLSVADGVEVLHLPGLHEGAIKGLNFKPDGRLFATLSGNKSVKLLSVLDGDVVLHLPELHGEGGILGLDFSPDGALIATASDDRSVKLTSVADGVVLLHLRDLHENSIISVSFSPDGMLLATASFDKSIKLYSVADGKVVLHLPGLHEGPIRGMSFSPDGALIATGSDDKSIKLTSLPDGEVVLHVPGLHEAWILGVSFSPDGRLLATASRDKSIKLTSVPDGEVLLHLPGLHEGGIFGLDFSPDGMLIATGTIDGSCAIVSLPSVFESNQPAVLPRIINRMLCCPSLRQCATLLDLATRAPTQGSAQAASMAASHLVQAIQNFPQLLAVPSSASLMGLLSMVLKNDNTPDAVLDAVIALLRTPDGAPRCITLQPDMNTGKSALRYALETQPLDRRAIGAILTSVATGFATKFGFVNKAAAPTLHDDIIFLAEDAPSCLDLLVTNFLANDGALTRLPAERQIGPVAHDFDSTGPLIEAGALAQEAPFRKFVDSEKFVGSSTAATVDTALAVLSVGRLSQAPSPALRSLLAILLDENCVAAFETPVIRLLVEHQWGTFGRRYAIMELVAFLVALLAPFTAFAVFVARVPHDVEFGDTVTYPTAVAYALCWPWLLRHAAQETKQLRKVGPARYVHSLWNLVDGGLVLNFAALGVALVLGNWLLGKYLAVAATLLVFLKAASQVGTLDRQHFVALLERFRAHPLLAYRAAAGLPTVRHAGADGGGLLCGLALLPAGLGHPHRRLLHHLHAARRGPSRRGHTW
jgi:WD40 repeat protein